MLYQINLVAAAAPVCAEHKGPPAGRARRGKSSANGGAFLRPPGTAGTRGPVFRARDMAGNQAIPQPTPPEGEQPREGGSAGSGLPERPARPAARDGSGAQGPVEPPCTAGLRDMATIGHLALSLGTQSLEGWRCL